MNDNLDYAGGGNFSYSSTARVIQHDHLFLHSDTVQGRVFLHSSSSFQLAHSTVGSRGMVHNFCLFVRGSPPPWIQCLGDDAGSLSEASMAYVQLR